MGALNSEVAPSLEVTVAVNDAGTAPGASTVSAKAQAPSASVMVGDSVTDVETARAAGLAGIILVSYGYTAIPAHALGADAVIDHLDDLPGALARLATPKS